MEETVTWAMVKFKVAKSRYLVRQGKSIENFKLCIQSEEMPSLIEKSVKLLGKSKTRHPR